MPERDLRVILPPRPGAGEVGTAAGDPLVGPSVRTIIRRGGFDIRDPTVPGGVRLPSAPPPTVDFVGRKPVTAQTLFEQQRFAAKAREQAAERARTKAAIAKAESAEQQAAALFEQSSAAFAKVPSREETLRAVEGLQRQASSARLIGDIDKSRRLNRQIESRITAFNVAVERASGLQSRAQARFSEAGQIRSEAGLEFVPRLPGERDFPEVIAPTIGVPRAGIDVPITVSPEEAALVERKARFTPEQQAAILAGLREERAFTTEFPELGLKPQVAFGRERIEAATRAELEKTAAAASIGLLGFGGVTAFAARGLTGLGLFGAEVAGGVAAATVVPEVVEPGLRALLPEKISRKEAEERIVISKTALGLAAFISGAKAVELGVRAAPGLVQAARRSLAPPKKAPFKRVDFFEAGAKAIEIEELAPGVFGRRVSPRPGAFRLEVGRIVKEPPVTTALLPVKFKPSPRPGVFAFEVGKIVKRPPVVSPLLPTKFKPSPLPGFFRFETGKIVKLPKPKKFVLPEEFKPSPMPGAFFFEAGRIVRAPPKAKAILPIKFRPSPKPGAFRFEVGEIVKEPLITKDLLPAKFKPSPRPGVFALEAGRVVKIAELKPKKRARPFPPEPVEEVSTAKLRKAFVAEGMAQTRAARRAITVQREAPGKEFLIPGSLAQLAKGLPRAQITVQPFGEVFIPKAAKISLAPFAEFRGIAAAQIPAFKPFKAAPLVGIVGLEDFRGRIVPALAFALRPGRARAAARLQVPSASLRAFDKSVERGLRRPFLKTVSSQLPRVGVIPREIPLTMQASTALDALGIKAIARVTPRAAAVARARERVREKAREKVKLKERIKFKPPIPTLGAPTTTAGKVVPERKRGFDVLLKVKGSFKRQNRRPLFRSTATALGAFLADKTAARTFKIVPTRRAALGKKKSIGSRARKFRKPIRKGKPVRTSPLLVEKVKFAIDSPGEKEEITRKGLLALRSGFFKKKRKKKKTKRRKR